jgi:hypothetical protein
LSAVFLHKANTLQIPQEDILSFTKTINTIADLINKTSFFRRRIFKMLNLLEMSIETVSHVVEDFLHNIAKVPAYKDCTAVTIG